MPERPEDVVPKPAEGAAEDEFQVPLIGVRLPRTSLPWLLAGLASILLLGWAFLRSLPPIWFDEEGYYSHGLLIPFMTAAVVYMRRDKMRSEPVGSSKLGLAVLALGLLILVASKAIDNLSLAGSGFILALLGGVYFAFGPRVGRHCVGPLLFLVFMMPVLGWVIDTYTNDLQLASTKVASKLLNIVGYETIIAPERPTTIHMNAYDLTVGGPCSGFKLILSLTAFTTFFIMISSLGHAKNLFLLLVLNPVLALFINGLRIMLIGIVGENADSQVGAWLSDVGGGQDPGMVFHDYSGYITLVVCFVILHYIVKLLEGKRENAAAA